MISDNEVFQLLTDAFVKARVALINSCFPGFFYKEDPMKTWYPSKWDKLNATGTIDAHEDRWVANALQLLTLERYTFPGSVFSIMVPTTNLASYSHRCAISGFVCDYDSGPCRGTIPREERCTVIGVSPLNDIMQNIRLVKSIWFSPKGYNFGRHVRVDLDKDVSLSFLTWFASPDRYSAPPESFVRLLFSLLAEWCWSEFIGEFVSSDKHDDLFLFFIATAKNITAKLFDVQDYNPMLLMLDSGELTSCGVQHVCKL